MSTHTNILGMTFRCCCLALAAVALAGGVALGQRAGPVQPETAWAPRTDDPVPTGIEVTFLPKELLEGIDWGPLLEDAEL